MSPDSHPERRFHLQLETPEGLRSIECGAPEHIWDAAAGAGITLPAVCHQGRCLSCAGLVIEGAVDGSIDHDEPDMYFDEDRRAAFVLLCRAMPRADARIRTHQAEQMREHRIAHDLPAPYA